MPSRVSFFTIIFCLVCTLACAQDALFPFLAEVKDKNVNVRSGQSINFARIIQLEKGDEVVVVGQEYGWYKIQLPALARVYISAKYITTSDNIMGTVVGNRVNIRPLPNVEHAAVGQVVEGQKLNIIQIKDDWVEIVPPEGMFGWIHEDFLVFKSKTIPEQPNIKVEVAVVDLEIQKPSDPAVKQPALKVHGYLQAYRMQPQQGQKIYYQLTIDGQPIYLIEGMKLILDDFIDYKVELMGDLDIGVQSTYPYPVISAKSVVLML